MGSQWAHKKHGVNNKRAKNERNEAFQLKNLNSNGLTMGSCAKKIRQD